MVLGEEEWADVAAGSRDNYIDIYEVMGYGIQRVGVCQGGNIPSVWMLETGTGGCRTFEFCDTCGLVGVL